MPGSIAGPGVTNLYDVPLPEKMTALVVADGGTPTIAWRLTDPATGAPIDLAPFADGGGDVACALKLQEATRAGGRFKVDATATVGNPILAPVTLSVLGGPGIFVGQVAALDGAGNPAVVNTFYLVVENSLWGANLPGPPRLSELRLQLRDSSPGENRLLDELQFDDAEVASCLVRAVEYWNNSLPSLTPETTQSFPFRELWLQGATALLWRMVAEWYRKNRLDYTAGGIAVGDLNKAQEYDQRADTAWGEFRAAVQSRKVGINMESCWGDAPSAYRNTGRYCR